LYKNFQKLCENVKGTEKFLQFKKKNG